MNWEQRKLIGDALERRVRDELIGRGWEVASWGQGVMPPKIREALSRGESRWKHFPDLVAARDGDVVTIDCKDRVSSAETGRFAVNRHCVSFGLQFLAAFALPVFYVFGNLGVLTPTEVQAYGRVGPRVHGGAYFLVNGRLAHHFDDIFGTLQAAQEAA